MPTLNPEVRPRRNTAPVWRRLIREAERLLLKGLPERAVQSLERAIAANGDGYACNLRIAEIHRSRQQWMDAYRAIERAAAISPARLDAHELALNIALESGDQARIFVACQSLIRLQPRHVAAHNTLGMLYMQMGDVDAAIRATNTLIRIEPQDAAHRFKKASLCQHKGEIALAVHEFGVVLLLEPEGPHADAAREALEALDIFQLNQIATLAMEDIVFRHKLTRNPYDAAAERGFVLSEMGAQVLMEMCLQSLSAMPTPIRTSLYN